MQTEKQEKKRTFTLAVTTRRNNHSGRGLSIQCAKKTIKNYKIDHRFSLLGTERGKDIQTMTKKSSDTWELCCTNHSSGASATQRWFGFNSDCCCIVFQQPLHTEHSQTLKHIEVFKNKEKPTWVIQARDWFSLEAHWRVTSKAVILGWFLKGSSAEVSFRSSTNSLWSPWKVTGIFFSWTTLVKERKKTDISDPYPHHRATHINRISVEYFTRTHWQ